MRLWEKKQGDALRCRICPHNCLLGDGERGICGARENRQGKIDLITSGFISGYALDPIEKKPLYHFHPGSMILSVGSYGCNLSCDFCQNFHISQNVTLGQSRHIEPAVLVRQAALTRGNAGIAYTYNEPVIWYEFVTETARLAAAEGLTNVMVTNGYVNPGPLEDYIRVIDAFNIDLKAFSNEFYRNYTGATLKPVLDSIKAIALSGRHLEITTLIIPGLNDSPEEMKQEAEWIAENAGTGVPLHLSRYFPMYRRSTSATPAETILALREIAEEYLDYVYTGNMGSDDGGSNTICPSCGTVAIRRSGYNIKITGLTDDGKCMNCGRQIIETELNQADPV
ncbi:MAG: AmmeMemoRadiSam system radical SAM enzyme [Bacteroidetes bacterium]|nr:MAG: AmmeMemoRadiSam system radical SAM enzyme [Bacteroidota bacterium]